jgi:hypothetical protein
MREQELHDLYRAPATEDRPPTFSIRHAVHVAAAVFVGWMAAEALSALLPRALVFVLAWVLMLSHGPVRPPEGVKHGAQKLIAKARENLDEKQLEVETKIEEERHDFAEARVKPR